MKAFDDLPRARTGAHERRKCGVEIEFSGLSEDETAQIVQSELGGQRSRVSDHLHAVDDTCLGRIVVELDTALKKYSDTQIVEEGLDLARNLIPVEIVTEPVDPGELDALERLRERLRAAGALGSAHGMLKGFGVHLNVEVVGLHDPFTRETIVAYGLLETWLRRSMPIDATRRVLPFVDPWPEAMIDDLVAADTPSLAELRAIYASHTQSRNHGLDLLPIFAAADEDGFKRDFPDIGKTSARPAYHFRLPDCRIDDADWRLADEWHRWQIVERVADDPDLMEQLREAWKSHRAHVTDRKADWTRTVQRLLDETASLDGAA